MTGRNIRNGDIRGFTLLELMIVVAIIGILATLAVPSFYGATGKARETVLRENLFAIRETIDQFYADHARYPASLEELQAVGYLRRVPDDPITKSPSTWVTVPPPDDTGAGIYDVRSGAPGTGSNGVPYAEW